MSTAPKKKLQFALHKNAQNHKYKVNGVKVWSATGRPV